MRLSTRRHFGRLGIYDWPSSRMSSREDEDFPECWTYKAVLAKLASIVSDSRPFKNRDLARIADRIAVNIRDHPQGVESAGIEYGLTIHDRPFKNTLLCMLNLEDRVRYPFDDPDCMLTFADRARHEEKYTRPSVLMWNIGVTYVDWRVWQWEDPQISEKETQIVKDILTLHQRIGSINLLGPTEAVTNVNYNYNRNGAGPGPGDGGGGPGPGDGGGGGGGQSPVALGKRRREGPGDGGGGGPGGVVKLHDRSVGASVPRDFAPMRAMLLDL
jgi:hypothetical protein